MTETAEHETLINELLNKARSTERVYHEAISSVLKGRALPRGIMQSKSIELETLLFDVAALRGVIGDALKDGYTLTAQTDDGSRQITDAAHFLSDVKAITVS